MQIHTEIGEIGVEHAGRAYRLRPSFAAMVRIGSPAEIVATFGAVLGAPPRLHGNPVLDDPRLRRWGRERFLAALTVLYACSEDDLGPLVGGISERMAYQPGAMPMDDVVTLAQALLKHGIAGDVPVDPRAAKGSFSPEFKARDYVALAMAHLGASEADAWAMTMTGFLLAMRAKYPPPDQPGSSAPSDQAQDATMAWLKAVNAKRGQPNG